MSTQTQISKDYGILDNIPKFNTEAHDMLEINMNARGDAVDKLRDELKRGTISHHNTAYGPYVILAYWNDETGLSYELFSYEDNGGQDRAALLCRAFHKEVKKLSNAKVV